ncbi:MAG: ASCH domain-containing protein [Hasllibacter sp.]
MTTLAELQARHPGAVPYTFGDWRELNAVLLMAVRAGTKTATCGPLRDFEAEGEPLPVVGRRDVALTWDGRPALVTETTEVTIHPFDDVPRDFAEAEGEGGYEGWYRGHKAWLERAGGWAPDVPMVCERFRVVEDLGAAPGDADDPGGPLGPLPDLAG